MREAKKFEIGDLEYCVMAMNPIKATKILTRLLKIMGKPLAKIIKQSKKSAPGESILDADLSEGLIGEALEALTERLDENQIEKLITDLLDKQYITYTEDGEEYKKLMNADAHFGGLDEGGLIKMFTLLRRVLEVNYSDFFGGLVDLKK